ncbi:pilin [Patescibacteria group bacterium]
MKNKQLFVVISFLVFGILGVVKVSYAKDVCCCKNTPVGGFIQTTCPAECEWKDESVCSGNTGDPTPPSQEINLQDPAGIGNTPQGLQILIGRIIKAVMGLVGSVALLMFVYGGFLWMTAAGNDEKVKKGKDIFVWATLGLAVIFLSYLLVHFVLTSLMI